MSSCPSPVIIPSLLPNGNQIKLLPAQVPPRTWQIGAILINLCIPSTVAVGLCR